VLKLLKDILAGPGARLSRVGEVGEYDFGMVFVQPGLDGDGHIECAVRVGDAELERVHAAGAGDVVDGLLRGIEHDGAIECELGEFKRPALSDQRERMKLSGVVLDFDGGDGPGLEAATAAVLGVAEGLACRGREPPLEFDNVDLLRLEIFDADEDTSSRRSPTRSWVKKRPGFQGFHAGRARSAWMSSPSSSMSSIRTRTSWSRSWSMRDFIARP